jgi:hypothetical protein
MIRIGDLVEIQRIGILIPKGTIALVMDLFAPTVNRPKHIASVLPLGNTKRYQYLPSDLKVISTSY